MGKNTKYDTCDSFVTKIIENECIKPMDSNIIFNSKSVSILPPNANWSDMEGFVSKKFGPFGFTFKNANNHTVAGITLYISYNCNGKFNSMGHYLADVTVSPKVIFAHPGYYLTCNVTATNPLNYGSKADPIPGIDLKLQMQVKSYNKLLLEEVYYSLENTSTSENSLISTKCSNSINLVSSNDYDSLINFYTPNKSTCPHASYTCSNGINTIEKYLIVNVRGDCQTSIVVACGY